MNALRWTSATLVVFSLGFVASNFAFDSVAINSASNETDQPTAVSESKDVKEIQTDVSTLTEAILKYNQRKYYEAAAMFRLGLADDPANLNAFRGYVNSCRMADDFCNRMSSSRNAPIATANCSKALSDLVAIAPSSESFSNKLRGGGPTLIDAYGHPDTAYQLVIRDFVQATSTFEKTPTSDLAALIIVLSDLIACTEDDYKKSPLYNSKLREGFIRYYPKHIREAYEEFAANFHRANGYQSQL